MIKLKTYEKVTKLT